MQKLDFNKDGKLVAFTDNGCTDGDSATTEVKGTFEVSAGVVYYILAKEYDLPAALRIEMGKEAFGYYSYKHLYCNIGNDRQQEVLDSFKRRLDEQHRELDEQQRELKSYRHKIEELSNVEKELKRLRKAVDDFNRTRRFFERKIKI